MAESLRWHLTRRAFIQSLLPTVIAMSIPTRSGTAIPAEIAGLTFDGKRSVFDCNGWTFSIDEREVSYLPVVRTG